MAVPARISAVPVIDVSDLHNRKLELSQRLLQAAEDVGFFQITGLQQTTAWLLQRTSQSSNNFFARPWLWSTRHRRSLCHERQVSASICRGVCISKLQAQKSLLHELWAGSAVNAKLQIQKVSDLSRYANLPDQIRARHVKDKSDTVYVLGWTERRVSGSATATLCPCFALLNCIKL